MVRIAADAKVLRHRDSHGRRWYFVMPGLFDAMAAGSALYRLKVKAEKARRAYNEWDYRPRRYRSHTMTKEGQHKSEALADAEQQERLALDDYCARFPGSLDEWETVTERQRYEYHPYK